jgi:FkbM family methyltransferase
MKVQVKKKIIRFLTLLASRLGYQLTALTPAAGNYQKDGLLFTFYNTLKQIGFEPQHIVDVGANRGTWTRETLKYFPNASYTLIEPQHWLKDFITDLTEHNQNIKFHAFGAGSKKGTFKFTVVDRDDSCSFRYTESEAKAGDFKQLQLPIITLNEFLPGLDLPTPDIIKIDAEGLDIDVLNGANNYFGKTEVIMVEAGIVNKVFENSFFKIINYMDTNGYTLFDITDINRPFVPAVLWLTELVFVKKNGVIDSKKFD